MCGYFRGARNTLAVDRAERSGKDTDNNIAMRARGTQFVCLSTLAPVPFFRKHALYLRCDWDPPPRRPAPGEVNSSPKRRLETREANVTIIGREVMRKIVRLPIQINGQCSFKLRIDRSHSNIHIQAEGSKKRDSAIPDTSYDIHVRLSRVSRAECGLRV